MTAGCPALAAIPVCRESGFTLCSSLCWSYYTFTILLLTVLKKDSENISPIARRNGLHLTNNLYICRASGREVTNDSNRHHPRRYNPCRVLADSRSRLQPSLSLVLLLQFLTPSLSASLITPSIHPRFGLPTRLLPSGLSKVIFLHGRLSCIRTICPAHLSLIILIVVTKSVSSYRRYSSSSYLDLHIAPSQIGP